MSKIEALVREAESLSPSERLELAHLLLKSGESSDSLVESAWDQEIRQRILALDNGLTSSRPASEVFQAWEARLDQNS
ncbi:MAG: addiction module protein [Acidobacteria bacterium]|nr:addiction module protein [Acidobacteriota bacterium]